MRRFYALVAALVLPLVLAPAWAGDEVGAGRAAVGDSRRLTLEQTVGQEVFRQAGLAKLTPEEQIVLAEWVRDYTTHITRYVEELCRRDQQKPAKP